MSSTRNVSTKTTKTHLLRAPNAVQGHRSPGSTARPAVASVTKLPVPPNRSAAGTTRSSPLNQATAPTFATKQKTRPIIPISSPRIVKVKTIPLPSQPSSPPKSVSVKSKPSSIFIGPHTWTHCTPGSLTHRLSTCEHQVITQDSEACGSNCLRRDYASDDELNIRNLDKAFICPVCRERMFTADSQGRKANLAEYLARMKALLGADGQRWDEWEACLSRDSEETWLAEEKRVRDALEKHGRRCDVLGGRSGAGAKGD